MLTSLATLVGVLWMGYVGAQGDDTPTFLRFVGTYLVGAFVGAAALYGLLR